MSLLAKAWFYLWVAPSAAVFFVCLWVGSGFDIKTVKSVLRAMDEGLKSEAERLVGQLRGALADIEPEDGA